MYPDQRVDAIARRQHGVFTRAQASAVGLTDNMIDARIASERWTKLAPGVYAHAVARATWERQLQAALLSKQGAITAGSSAARLHRIDGFPPTRPVIMVPSHVNSRSAIASVIRCSDFVSVGRATVAGFPVTNVAETLWTLARTIDRARLDELVSQQVSMGYTTIGQLQEVLTRVAASRQRGLPAFRRVVQTLDPQSEARASTLLEALLYRLLSSPGIPSVSRQHRFALDEPARVDAYVPDWRVVAEADGRNWHTRQSDFQRDRERDNQLAARGIIVIRFTHTDLTTRFDHCLRTLLEVGHHRSVKTMS